VARNAPVLDDNLDDASVRTRGGPRRVDRRARQRQRDLLTVGVLTPALVVCLAGSILLLGQTFYPDAYVEPTVVPTPTRQAAREVPTPVPVAQPIDPARLNAGIVDKPPALEWPEVSGLKVQPDPGRALEHADYVPDLANVELRRLIAAFSVNVVLHSTPAFAAGAVDELTKPYPAQRRKGMVLDLDATTGYVPDDSVFGVVFTFSGYRIQIEAIPTTPPISLGQRSQVEYETLHLADHLARRLQEASTGGRRTGPEETAVHWRDHVARTLPFGR
jgi:hypothetical protein